MSQNFELSEKDFKTRRLWLIVNFLCSIIFPVIIAVGSLLLSHEGSFWSTLLTLAVTLVFCFFALVVPFYILYHCAYARPGTRLLTWVLVLSPLGMLYNLGVTFKAGWNIGESAWFNLALGMLVFSWTYVLNLRLRRINKLLQAREGDACPEFAQELARMKNVLSLEVLDYAYQQLIAKWPQWKHIAALEYKRKKMLIR